MIQIKRVYDPPHDSDAVRYLVERLWPRGLKKEALRADGWLKDVAPSDGLRRWFGHDPNMIRRSGRSFSGAIGPSWTEIPRRQLLLQAARQGGLTLLYSTRDTEHNNAVALKAYLGERLAKKDAIRT